MLTHKKTVSLYMVAVIFGLMMFSACGNSYEQDISDTPAANTHIIRYEQALFQQPLTAAYLDSLQTVFPLFLGTAPLHEAQINQLQAYVKNPFLDTLYKVSQARFPTMAPSAQALGQAFRYVKHYYPSFSYPQVYTYISGKFDPAFIEDTTLLISIDRFLGPNTKLYSQAGIAHYQQRSMQPSYLPRHVLSVLATHFIPPVGPNAQLLDHMLYQAKVLLFIQHMLPTISPSILFNQSAPHLQWLQDKEGDMWRYYIENELLFTSDYMAYNKCIGQAPFSSIFGQDSAPRTGIWLGYQILTSYQAASKKTLPEILKNTNSQAILQASQYKPE